MSKEKVPAKPLNPFAVAFGKRLREVREAKLNPPLTQESLGTQVASKKAKVSQWETGKHMPDLEMLAALCDALGCSADYLLGRTTHKLSAAALEEAKAFDDLPADLKKKWRAMRLTLFSPA